jgi:hypothetical protein
VDTESLFLRTLDDLEKCTKVTDEYEVLLAAALFYALLRDFVVEPERPHIECDVHLRAVLSAGLRLIGSGDISRALAQATALCVDEPT